MVDLPMDGLSTIKPTSFGFLKRHIDVFLPEMIDMHLHFHIDDRSGIDQESTRETIEDEFMMNGLAKDTCTKMINVEII